MSDSGDSAGGDPNDIVLSDQSGGIAPLDRQHTSVDSGGGAQHQQPQQLLQLPLPPSPRQDNRIETPETGEASSRAVGEGASRLPEGATMAHSPTAHGASETPVEVGMAVQLVLPAFHRSVRPLSFLW